MMKAATGCIVVGALIVAATAGPLNPPGGPVAPTYKTLAEIEPRTAVQSLSGDAQSLYVITQPGSYYLTGDISGVAGKHAIRVAADGVTLDLMGFSLDGQGSNSAAIFVAATVQPSEVRSHLVVRNGTIRGWLAGVGMNVLGQLRDSRFEALRVHDCSGPGVVVGARCIVHACTAQNNGGDGIVQNGGPGVFTGCVALSNGGQGITAGPGSTIDGCTALGNAGAGINASAHCSITDCVANLNGVHGVLAAASTIARCTVAGNTLEGIRISGGTVSGCTANGNQRVGIYGDLAGVTISGCSVNLNHDDGIQVQGDALVIGNTCDGNGNGLLVRSGIGVYGSNNRVEGNTCTDNDVGIATAAGAVSNLFIRNSVSGNGIGYQILAGNTIGPIVTAATIATNANPHANYEF